MIQYSMASASSKVYFQTSDNLDGTFWISGATDALAFGNVRYIQVGLELNPDTSMADADALAALLRKHVETSSLLTIEHLR